MWPFKAKSDTAPPDHPYSEAGECWRWQQDRPCKCPAWREVLHKRPDAEGGPMVVKGCHFHLFEFMISGAIVATNEMKEDFNAVRQDVQQGTAVATYAARLVESCLTIGPGSVMRVLSEPATPAPLGCLPEPNSDERTR